MDYEKWGLSEYMSIEKNVYKIMMFGDSNVGKSTLVKRWVSDHYIENMPKTIGVEFRSKVVYVDNLAITLQIWDFSGEIRFDFLLEMYSRGVVGGIFVFDMSDNDSMLHLNNWVTRVRSYTSKDFPILIVGTKMDLSERKPNKKEDEEDSNMIFLCSAKTGENIDDVFQALAERIYYERKELGI